MKILRFLSLSLVFVSIAMVSPSCYREPLHPVTKQYVLMDSFCRDYFDSYKQGSQWIYQLQGTNQLDTTTETLFQRIYETSDALLLSNYIELFYEGDYNNFKCSLAPSYSSLVYSGDTSYIFEMLYQVGSGISIEESNMNFTQVPGTGSVAQVSILDTLKVLNHIFTDVLFLKNYKEQGYIELYFVKNLGIVKKKVDDQHIYLLEDWKINR